MYPLHFLLLGLLWISCLMYPKSFMLTRSGNQIFMDMGSDIPYGEILLVESRIPREFGDLTVYNEFGDTPDSRILIAGTENNIVAGFEFESEFEPVHVEDLTLHIKGVDTLGSGRLSIDQPDDRKAVKNSVSILWRWNGGSHS